jgi:hypothetical protein
MSPKQQRPLWVLSEHPQSSFYQKAVVLIWRAGHDLELPTLGMYPFRITYVDSRLPDKHKPEGILLQQCVKTRWEETNTISASAWRRTKEDLTSSDVTPTICGLLEDGYDFAKQDCHRGGCTRFPALLEDAFQASMTSMGTLVCGLCGLKTIAAKWEIARGMGLEEERDLEFYFFVRANEGWILGTKEGMPNTVLVFKPSWTEEYRRVVCFFGHTWMYPSPSPGWAVWTRFDAARPSGLFKQPRQEGLGKRFADPTLGDGKPSRPPRPRAASYGATSDAPDEQETRLEEDEKESREREMLAEEARGASGGRA